MGREKKNGIPAANILANNMFLLRVVIKAAPLTTIFALIKGAFFDVVVFFEHTYQLVYIVDCIQNGRPFSDALVMILAMFILVSIKLIIDMFMRHKVTPKGMEKIYKAFREMLYEKAKDIDISCYDNPEFYNDYVFAVENATSRVDGVLNTASNLIANIVMLFVLGGYILFTDSLSVVFVAAGFFAAYFLRTISAKTSFELNNALNPILRKRDYINRVFYLPDYAKEIRLSKVSERLIDEYAQTEKQVYDELKKKTKKIAVLNFIQEYLSESFIFDLVYLLYLMFLAIVKQVLSFGSLYGLYRSVQWAKGYVEGFSYRFSELREHSLYIEKVRNFLAYEQKVVSKPDALPVGEENGTLELKNVSFTYLGVKEPTLSNVSFTVKPGEKIAIVGYNGAGKTTLVKLLMRLYDSSDGEVRYAGKDIRNYNLDAFRNLFSTLFQDYQIYAANVTQNILAGNQEPNETRIMEVLEASGLAGRVSKMSKGINSQLTREFEDGEELSGGEKQKLAISRSLYKDSRIIILDEPSSALDPIAEYELNNTMLKLGRDKTVIFISHRLSTTKMADRILMFEKGKLIESGNHNELLGLNGKYAEMFRLQAEKYR